MGKFIRPNFEIISESADQAECTVVVDPLDRGFATTLGVALRRVLLSSVPGAAAYAVRFAKANHEFVAISGVVENAAKIILNIKKLAIKFDESVFDTNEDAVFKIEFPHKGDVLAKDIECPIGFSIENPDLYIASVSEGPFEMEIYVRIDHGFESFSKNKIHLRRGEGIIAIDSNYSPVTNVHFEIEPTKIGRAKDLEKLILTVQTNKCTTAKSAIGYASKVIISHLQQFEQWSTLIKTEKLMVESQVEEERILLRADLSELNLSVRSYNALKQSGIETIDELIQITPQNLQNIKNLGKKSIDEIIEKLNQNNLKLKTI